MRRLLVIACLLAATSVLAEELTATAVISAFKLGATAEALIAQITDPANTVGPLSPRDLASLNASAVPDRVIQAMVARAPAPTPTPAPPRPDDPRLIDIVRMLKSGLSESLVTDQIKRSGEHYQLTSNDLIYLKASEVSEPIIVLLLSTKPEPPAAGAPGMAQTPAPTATPEPQEVTIQNLVLYKPTIFQKDRNGRVVIKNDEVNWIDGSDPRENFSFRMLGIEKVWFTCQSRPSAQFCFQINIQIVKGARYRFRDRNRERGNNDAVKQFEAVIKKDFPTISWTPPEVGD